MIDQGKVHIRTNHGTFLAAGDDEKIVQMRGVPNDKATWQMTKFESAVRTTYSFETLDGSPLRYSRYQVDGEWITDIHHGPERGRRSYGQWTLDSDGEIVRIVMRGTVPPRYLIAYAHDGAGLNATIDPTGGAAHPRATEFTIVEAGTITEQPGTPSTPSGTPTSPLGTPTSPPGTQPSPSGTPSNEQTDDASQPFGNEDDGSSYWMNIGIALAVAILLLFVVSLS